MAAGLTRRRWRVCEVLMLALAPVPIGAGKGGDGGPDDTHAGPAGIGAAGGGRWWKVLSTETV